MKGAREFSDVIGREVIRHKKLVIHAGEHARGKTLHIWVVDSATAEIPNIYLYANRVEVYGIINGQPGWTEEYGWLHRGHWEKDFFELVEQRRAEKQIKHDAFVRAKDEERLKQTDLEQSVLKSY